MSFSRKALTATLSVALLTTAACSLPRSGPKKDEILSASALAESKAFVVPMSDSVVAATSVASQTGFSAAFRNAGLMGSDTISPGDTLNLAIWENVDDGLLAQQGLGSTQLAGLQVDGTGQIFVPYAGRIQAAGNSPDELRRIITEKLATQTPDPQVSVTRVAGDGATVSIMGAIGGQGVYPLERPTRTLATMLAKAGGVSAKPEVTKITVKRGKNTGSIWLRDLYANPQLDIALRPGDVILIEEDRRAFISLGALGQQARVPFQVPEMSALDAVASVGGLQSGLADPTGIFVFRDESAPVAGQILGRADLVGDQRMIYVLDLTAPEGIFLAREFDIRDGDTVYVTEAPYVQWHKTLSALTGSVSTANSLGSIVN
ncbi:polysaccharide biosynthesis/export family protein [Sedimentimonas flavescens]|uniref:Polysaccharide biosynthesis/export family protein n=1 Tax=Sedimentimonas flavescens TaxID=2851012 RepID=A0ABT2ZUZ0_9RHOB|nr:polysaccharide biosynthesis/export family protein [Sedimentimonas flavescens]MCV2877561.1 polysaccharide biosynthesis/export family protein [Sedimentimonas flavescens]